VNVRALVEVLVPHCGGFCAESPHTSLVTYNHYVFDALAGVNPELLVGR
jgi:hypothetical protein